MQVTRINYSHRHEEQHKTEKHRGEPTRRNAGRDDNAASIGESKLTDIPSTKKLRGGYYTPRILADCMANSVIRSPKATVLEPSCGNGSLLESAAKRLIELGAKKEEIPGILTGIEINSDEAEKAKKRLTRLGIPFTEKAIHNSDFFQYCKSNLFGKRDFSAVIGNPPFIRYQTFPPEIKQIAFELMKEAGLNPIGHTNSWVPFLVVSSLLLKKDGLLAMIVPAQLFQVNYAAETRRFLSGYYKKLTIVTFRKLAFQDVQQDIVILVGERDNNINEGIKIVELEDITSLGNRKTDLTKLSARNEFKPLDHTRDKWTQYFLDTDEILLLRELRDDYDLTLFGDIVEVDIGVVTGRNSYFVMNEIEAKKRELTPYTERIVCRSSDLEGTHFSNNDLITCAEKGSPTYLFKPPDMPLENLPQSVKTYIEHGEKYKIHKGYKCRIRNEWYQVPSIWIPDAFMLRQIHGYPKIVLNETTATCTDTIHRVKFSNGKLGKEGALAFMNSMTFGFSEIIGRSYGGGVLTLEPNEAERLPIPIEGAGNLDYDMINNLERENRVDELLVMTDEILLRQGLGLTEKKVVMLRNIWKKLSYRRLNMSPKKIC